MKKLSISLVFVGICAFFVGCAVRQYLQDEDIGVDSAGISKELSEKWAVAETPEASVATPKSPTPALGGKGKSATSAALAVPVASNGAPAALATNGKAGRSKESASANAAAKGKKKDPVDFPVRRGEKMPFSPGERTVMSITYMGVEAGTLDLRVLPYKYIGGRKAFHFRGHGLSTSVFALFYRVNDIGEAFMDYDGLFSHKFQLKVDESRQQRDLVELYDQKAHQIHYWEKLVHEKKGLRITQFTKEIENFAQDAVSAVFYLRTFPLEVGKEYSYPMVTNGKVWTITARVLRKEDLVTPLGTIPAVVVQPETRFEGAIKTTGDSFLWISDDEHHNILKMDAKVKIGSVIAYLKDLKQGTGE